MAAGPCPALLSLSLQLWVVRGGQIDATGACAGLRSARRETLLLFGRVAGAGFYGGELLINRGNLIAKF